MTVIFGIIRYCNFNAHSTPVVLSLCLCLSLSHGWLAFSFDSFVRADTIDTVAYFSLSEGKSSVEQPVGLLNRVCKV